MNSRHFYKQHSPVIFVMEMPCVLCELGLEVWKDLLHQGGQPSDPSWGHLSRLDPPLSAVTLPTHIIMTRPNLRRLNTFKS
jgi:hypothetical protein